MSESNLNFLLASLRDEELDVQSRRAAADKLGKSGDVRAVEPLAEVMEDDWYHDICLAVVTALGEIGHPSAIPALVEALEDHDDAVHKAAEAALSRIGDPAVPVLIEALVGEPLRYKYPRRPPSPRNREAVAALLGKIGGASSIAPLVKCLDGRDPYLEMAVAKALIVLTSRCPVPELRSALPPLRRRVRQGLLAKSSPFHQVIRQIEAATAPVKSLPVPVAAPLPSVENLPVPATSPAPSMDSLPIPAGAAREEGTETASGSALIGRFRLRRLLRRIREGRHGGATGD